MEKINIIKLIIFSIGSIFLTIIWCYYSLICIDYILPNYQYNLLVKLTIIFTIANIFKNIFVFSRNFILNKVQMNISIKLNKDIIKKYFNLPYQFFKNKSIGECISRLNDLKIFKNIFS